MEKKVKKPLILITALLGLLLSGALVYALVTNTNLNKENIELNGQVADLSAKHEAQKKTNKSQAAAIEKLAGEKRELAKQIDRAKGDLNAAIKNGNLQKKEIDDLKNKLTSLEDRYIILENYNKKLLGEKDVSDGDLEKKGNEVAELQEQVRSLKEEIKKWEEDYTALAEKEFEKLISEAKKKQLDEVIINSAYPKVATVELTNDRGRLLTFINGNKYKEWTVSNLGIEFLGFHTQYVEGKTFAVEIYDEEKRICLREGQTGDCTVFSTVENGSLHVEFFNYEKKDGNNFRLKVYYVPDPQNLNEKYELRNSIGNPELVFVKNKKINI